MKSFMCIEHQGHPADVAAFVNVRTALANSTSWFITEPYGNQRPSGAPPG